MSTTIEDYKTIELPSNYKPKRSEPYMCPMQLAYFYRILTAQKEEILNKKDSVLNAVRLAEKTATFGVGDESDNATFNQDITMDLRMSDRNDKLLQKIDIALTRLENCLNKNLDDDKKFGYSIVSGEEIGLQRMMARPLATMTVEEQEEYEARKN
ncbi:MAG: TraR/DksA C4-type zinc finger protein [Alphaproteobacteria bacterium]|nr:TraR/DksA C4-type zinc finger protein [Alphaproteobacteria bacterium]